MESVDAEYADNVTGDASGCEVMGGRYVAMRKGLFEWTWVWRRDVK